jgi:hypothetical protein
VSADIEALAASPSSGVNAVMGAGLADALAGADVVVDASNSPSFENAAVLEFFETSTRNLLAAEADAGVAAFRARSRPWCIATESPPTRGARHHYSIPECDDISTCNSNHLCDRLGPNRFIDVGRRHFQDFIFRTDNIRILS